MFSFCRLLKSTLKNKPDILLQYHMTRYLYTIPMYCRGRDFDKHGNFLIGTTLAGHDMGGGGQFFNILFPDCKYCGFITKCQNLIINHPFTMEFAPKSMDTLPMKLTTYDVDIGTTSMTSIRELTYDNNIALTSLCRINVHINPSTRKPEKVCENTRNLVLENIKQVAYKQQEFDEKHLILKTNVNKMTDINIESNRKTLFTHMIGIRWTDLDIRGHVTQSCYAEYIENALYQYDKQYFEGKLWIHQIAFVFMKEILMDHKITDNSCHVNILHDYNNIELKQREIIGNITKNDILSCQFCVIVKDRNS
eukprot:528557_1